MVLTLDNLHFLSVDGSIGAGKSSLAKILAQDLGARMVCEKPDANPFLPLFYQDPARHAFQTQLFFLLSRYQQHKELKQQELFNQKVICDYVFAKDLVFAQLNLTEDEFNLYLEVYHLLNQRLPKPDVVIFLQAEPKVLLERIRMREKPYEEAIDEEYLLRVSQAFSEYFFGYNDSPLLVVNTSGLDFVHRREDYELLKKELFALIKSGHQKHYVTIDQR